MRFCSDQEGELNTKKYNGIREEIIYKSMTRKRTIYLYDVIDDDAELIFNYAIEKMCTPKDGKKLPIKVKISTDGGGAFNAFSIVSAMETAQKLGYEVHTYAYGRIFSAGTIIAASGTQGKRYAQRFTRYLLHDLNSFFLGGMTSEEISRVSFDMKDVLEVYKKILLSKTKVSSKMFDSHVGKISDWQFWSEDALKYKLVDEIF